MEKLQASNPVAYRFPLPLPHIFRASQPESHPKNFPNYVPKIYVRLYLGIKRRGDEQDKCASGRASRTSRVLPQFSLAAFVLRILHSGTI